MLNLFDLIECKHWKMFSILLYLLNTIVFIIIHDINPFYFESEYYLKLKILLLSLKFFKEYNNRYRKGKKCFKFERQTQSKNNSFDQSAIEINYLWSILNNFDSIFLFLFLLFNVEQYYSRLQKKLNPKMPLYEDDRFS
ncbi:hypothetical protein RFI_35654 [Reticulomyxa filosa]|uniref:Uncharacterized protein n=1 Tax=Reticulomyxa filosa TaxID=46433 RepID=X6LM31_RETFI|nr:hypothetical protein RFI_35654 [Reticulomyxa filosa]|eukprot:ETO01785.1 hypothetical protein RFI_35654 [Reticulomyxa filosa]